MMIGQDSVKQDAWDSIKVGLIYKTGPRGIESPVSNSSASINPLPSMSISANIFSKKVSCSASSPPPPLPDTATEEI